MIDRLFAPILALCVLFGGTFAIGSAWFESRSTVQTVRLPSVRVEVVRLPSVDVVAKQAALPLHVATTGPAVASDAPARRTQ